MAARQNIVLCHIVLLGLETSTGCLLVINRLVHPEQLDKIHPIHSPAEVENEIAQKHFAHQTIFSPDLKLLLQCPALVTLFQLTFQ